LAVAARSPVVYLAAVVGLSVLVRLAIGLATPSPWILPDELLYTELARAIADGGLPAVRGETTLGWGVVYPLLIAPAWALFSDPVAAYHASLVINAVVMSLAAVPAYLLARLFVPRTPALLVAAGTVLIPSMALTATVMTENAAYPLLLLAVWLMTRAVRRPTLAGQLLVVGAVALGAATRVSGAVLLPAFVVAAGLYALTSQPGERFAYLRRYTPTAVVIAATVALPLLAGLVTGRGAGWFGERSGTLQYVEPGPFLRLLLFQTGDLILYVAVLPALAAAVMMGMGLSRRAAEPERLYAAVALPSVVAVLGSGVSVSSTYGIDGSTGLNERYVFAVVPLLLLGLALWIHTGLPRPRWALPLVAVVALLAALLPWDVLEVDARSYAQSLAPWVALPLGRVGTGAVVAVCVLLLGLLWLRWGPERPSMLWVTTLVAVGLLGVVTVMGYASRAEAANDALGATRPTWVEDAIPPGAHVAVVWDHGRGEQGARQVGWIVRSDFQLMLAELFNPSIGIVYRLDEPTITENHLPTRAAQVDGSGVVVGEDGRPVVAGIVLTPCTLGVDGRRLAQSTDGGLVLTKVNSSLSVRVTSCNRTGG
jgi:hypothetical protein